MLDTMYDFTKGCWNCIYWHPRDLNNKFDIGDCEYRHSSQWYDDVLGCCIKKGSENEIQEY